jgi:hypothetical protein
MTRRNNTAPPVALDRLVLPLWEWIETNTPIEMWVAKADESTEYMVIRQRKEWLSRVCYGTRYKRVVSVWDNPHHTEPSLEDAKLQCAHHYLQNSILSPPASADNHTP